MSDLPGYLGGYAAAFPGAGRLGTAAAHILHGDHEQVGQPNPLGVGPSSVPNCHLESWT